MKVVTQLQPGLNNIVGLTTKTDKGETKVLEYDNETGRTVMEIPDLLLTQHAGLRGETGQQGSPIFVSSRTFTEIDKLQSIGRQNREGYTPVKISYLTDVLNEINFIKGTVISYEYVYGYGNGNTPIAIRIGL